MFLVNAGGMAADTLGGRLRCRTVMVAGLTKDFWCGVEGVSKSIALDVTFQRDNMSLVVEDIGCVLVFERINDDAVLCPLGIKVVNGFFGSKSSLSKGDILFCVELALDALNELFFRHGRNVCMTNGTPLIIACGLHNIVTTGTFGALSVDLFMTADTALWCTLAFALSNVGGMHGPFKVDKIAFSLALNRVTGCTGNGIARVMTGFAFLYFAFMNFVVEHHRFHADCPAVGFVTGGKKHHCRLCAAFCMFRGISGHQAFGLSEQKTCCASKSNSHQQKQFCAVPHRYCPFVQTVSKIPAAAPRCDKVLLYRKKSRTEHSAPNTPKASCESDQLSLI